MSWFEGFRSSNVPVEIVDGFTASLNVAVTTVAVLMPVAPFAGDTDVMVGGVVSDGADVLNTTSTQYPSEL
jgi:hypothetical protein